MDLSINVKVTVEASPSIMSLLDGWMRQLERQQRDYLNVLLDTVDERCQREKAEPVVNVVNDLPAQCEAVPSKCEVVETPAEPEAPAEAVEEPKPEPLTKEEEADLRKLAGTFIRAGGDNRTVLKNWLDSKGFERVTAVTRDQLEELKEVLKVA